MNKDIRKYLVMFLLLCLIIPSLNTHASNDIMQNTELNTESIITQADEEVINQIIPSQEEMKTYTADEVGFIILSESHAAYLNLSKPHFDTNEDQKSTVPKKNYAIVGNPSMQCPLFWSGGITIWRNGKKYEAFECINSEMVKNPSVKFWYILYFAGTNDVKLQGATSAIEAMKKNIEALSTHQFSTPHVVGVVTTPHLYIGSRALNKSIDKYDDAEYDVLKNQNRQYLYYDARDDFDSFVEAGSLLGSEYEHYSATKANDGVHYYSKQYWEVISNACNVIYN